MVLHEIDLAQARLISNVLPYLLRQRQRIFTWVGDISDDHYCDAILLEHTSDAS